jgi:hypothetical protein
MMKTKFRLCVAVGLLGLGVAACAPEASPTPAKTATEDTAVDPLKALPDNYKLEFENDYIRVVRVHYDVGAKLPEHIHPAGMTAYVYLNDNEGVIFNHAGGGERPYLRPPVKAGGARFQTSTEEHHTLENVSPTPSDFIRVWYKTDKLDLGNAIRRRIALSEAEYSNKATRISRPSFDAGKPYVVPVSAHPSLLVAWPSGAHRWIDPNASPSIPTGDTDTKGFVRIEFLTAPLKPK